MLCVDLGWLPGSHPAALSVCFLSKTMGKVRWKSSLVKIRTQRDFSPVTTVGKTSLAWGKLIYLTANLETV